MIYTGVKTCNLQIETCFYPGPDENRGTCLQVIGVNWID